MLFLFIGLTIVTNKFLPTGFIPMEDQGMVYVSVTTPQGATVERTEKVLDEVTGIAKKINGVEKRNHFSRIQHCNGNCRLILRNGND